MSERREIEGVEGREEEFLYTQKICLNPLKIPFLIILKEDEKKNR